jgi:hypothetical protein
VFKGHPTACQCQIVMPFIFLWGVTSVKIALSAPSAPGRLLIFLEHQHIWTSAKGKRDVLGLSST